MKWSGVVLRAVWSLVLGCMVASAETLTGTVTEAGVGTPIQGATITVVGLGSWTVTNASGQYAFGDLPDGAYTVTAAKPGYITQSRQVTLGPVPDTEPPTVPTNLTASTRSATSVTLTWTASTDNVGVTGYHVRRDAVIVATVTGTSYIDTGLTPGTTYQYRVRAFDAAGNASAYTSVLPVVTLTGGDTTPPTAPTNLQLVSKTSVTVTISWTASTDNVGVAGYQVLRGGSPVGTATVTGFTDVNLAPGTQYVYTVRAYDAAGNYSAASALLTVVTDVAPGQQPGPVLTEGEVRVTGGSSGYADLRQDVVNVAFRLTAAGTVSVNIYCMRGRLVWKGSRTLAQAGQGSLDWRGVNTDGENVPAGVYIAVVKGPGVDTRKKIVITR